MKRYILTASLAWLLTACAQPGTHAPAGAADPTAAVPATRYQPAIDGRAAPAPAASPDQGWRAANATVGGRNPMRLTMPGMDGEHQHDAAPADTGKTIPLHQHHDDMDMQGMQCMADGTDGCCAGKDKADTHAGHATMAMGGGCCCGHDAVAGQPAACKAGSTCACCSHKGAM
jgi:hypothetical protein